MSQFQKMSDSEMEVMRIIWASGGPVTSAQIQSVLGTKKGWKATTLLTFLSRLCEKGLLKIQKDGKSNIYCPRISETEYKRAETRAFLNNVHQGSLKSFVAALADEDLTREELDELKEWFEQK